MERRLAARPGHPRVLSGKVPHYVFPDAWRRRHVDARNTDLRNAMRVVGPALLLVGLVMFFSLVGRMQSMSGSPNPLPGFLGVFLIGVGGMITRWAWMGPAATYAAHETAPAVGIVARTVMGEVRGGGGIACVKCRTQNAQDASFCKSCGGSLRRACPSCGGGNAPDARFCDDCGKPLRT